MAAEVAAELSMQLPPVNGAAVLHRFISDLHLSKAMTPPSWMLPIFAKSPAYSGGLKLDY